MATYQEQLSRLAEQKAKDEKSYSAFNSFVQILADSLMSLVVDGTITQDQASKVIVAIVRGSVDAKREGKL